MKRFFLIIGALIVTAGIFPRHVLATECSANSYECSCTGTASDPTAGEESITSTTGDQCNTVCAKYTSYSLTCTLTDGTKKSPVAQGTVTLATPTTPASSEPVKDPIVPLLNIQIPGFKGFDKPVVSEGYTISNFIGPYIIAVYNFILPAAALVAVVMMMIGGLQYVLSRGKEKYITKAKERITGAITGIILLLLVYNIAFFINPATTVFSALRVQTIPEIPEENIVEFGEGVTPSGDLSGKSDWQDCMLNTFGKTETEVDLQLVSVTYNGKTYKAHKRIATNLQAAFNEIAATNIGYSITSIGIQKWRANVNNTSALSFHSWGVALDINPATNQNCLSQTAKGESCKRDIPQQIVDIFGKHNFGWGGNWKKSTDYMHFSATDTSCGGYR